MTHTSSVNQEIILNFVDISNQFQQVGSTEQNCNSHVVKGSSWWVILKALEQGMGSEESNEQGKTSLRYSPVGSVNSPPFALEFGIYFKDIV
jgi:hypothetical protein